MLVSKDALRTLHRALEAQSCSCTQPAHGSIWFPCTAPEKDGASACALWLWAGWWEEKQTALLLRTTSACCCLKQISLLLKRPGMMSCQALLQATPQGSCRFETNSKVVEENKTHQKNLKKNLKNIPRNQLKPLSRLGSSTQKAEAGRFHSTKEKYSPHPLA